MYVIAGAPVREQKYGMERLQISVNGNDSSGGFRIRERWEGSTPTVGGKCCKLAHVVRLDPIHLCNCDVSGLKIS